MQIYDKPVRTLLRDMVSHLGIKDGQAFSKDQALSWFRSRYAKIKEGTVSAHLIRMSTNARSRVHYGAKPDDDAFYQVDGSHFRLFDPRTDPAPIYKDSALSERDCSGADQVDTDADELGKEFAYEADLQNSLARNLSTLGSGLRLYEEEGVTGIQFPVGGRFIDILAVDQKATTSSSSSRSPEHTTALWASFSVTCHGSRSITPSRGRRCAASSLDGRSPRI